MSTRTRFVITAEAHAEFDAKLDKSGECWLFTGAKSDGYGMYKRERAHRLAWSIEHGERPGERIIMHTCDVPSCCNPKHLVAGTQADNMRDKQAKGRAYAGPMHMWSRLYSVPLGALSMGS